jgi:putative MFS transporter
LTSFALLRGLVGFGYAGNLLAGSILLVELVSADTRARKVFIAGTGYGLGAVVITVVTWSVVEGGLGWRWLLRIASAIGLPCVLLLLWVPESPRFHLARRDFDACVQVMEHVCSRNGAELPASFTAGELAAAHAETKMTNECLRSCTGEGLLRWVILRTLMPLAGIAFLNAFIMALLLWTPMASASLFPAQQDTIFFVQLTIALAQVLCLCLVALTAEMLPRLLQIRLTIGLQCAVLAFLGVASKNRSYAAFLACVALVTTTNETVWALIHVYTPEVFPTRVRAAACTVVSVMTRLAPIAAPYAIVALEGVSSFALLCGVFSVISFGGLCLAFALTVETASRALVEETTLEQGDDAVPALPSGKDSSSFREHLA